MKRILLIGILGVLMLGLLFGGLVLGLLVSPARAQVGQAINQVLHQANFNIRQPRVIAAQGSTPQLQVKDENGVLIAGVFVGSPADTAGLKRGDIILSVEGTEVNTQQDLRDVLSKQKVGDTIELSVRHGDTLKTMSVTLAEPPAATQAQPNAAQGQNVTPVPGQSATPAPGQNTLPHRSQLSSVPFLGIIPSSIKDWQSDKMGPGFIHPPIPNNGQAVPDLQAPVNGAPIVEVLSGSPAEKAGIQAGDTILAVDETAVDAQNTLPALITSHKPGDSVTLTIQPASGDQREVNVTLGDNPNNAGSAWMGVSIGGTLRFHQNGNPLPGSPMPGNPLPGNPMPGNPMPRLPELNPDGTPNAVPGLTMHPGAIIEEVSAGSPAEKAGLKVGQFIQSVDGTDLAGPQDLVTAIGSHKPGDTVSLTVFDAGSTSASKTIEVTLDENPQKAGAAWLGVRFSFFNIQPGQQPSDNFQKG